MGVIIFIIAVVIIWSWISGINQRQREAERQAELARIKRQAEQKRAEELRVAEEKRKFDELMNETVTVVDVRTSANNKPSATLKRNDTTYAYVERTANGLPFKYGNLKLPRATTGKLEWISEEKFKQDDSKNNNRAQNGFKKWIKEIQQVEKIKTFGVEYLYHMTHKDNIENVLNNGLLSHNMARNDGFIKTDIADNQVNDRRSKREPIFGRSIHEYVPLYFNPKNPMLFVRNNMEDDIVIIAVESRVMTMENSLFTNGNAAATSTSFYLDLEDLKNLDWKCIQADYWNDFPDGKRIRCSEVLVFPKIEISDIARIYCNDASTANFVKSKVSDSSHIKVNVNNDFYFNVSHHSNYNNRKRFYDYDEPYYL